MLLNRRSQFTAAAIGLALGLLGPLVRAAPAEAPSLHGARIPHPDFEGASLAGADLRACVLRTAVFASADLRGANLQGSDIRQANFTGANLTGADLGGCDLRCGVFAAARLRGANLQGAHLEAADLSTADLANVDIRECTYNRLTSWPPGVDPEACGARHCIVSSDRADSGCKPLLAPGTVQPAWKQLP